VYVRPDAVESVVARIPDLAAAAGSGALFVAEHYLSVRGRA
jgi:hypothetical protein